MLNTFYLMVTFRNRLYKLNILRVIANIQGWHSTFYTKMPETKALEHKNIISNSFPNNMWRYYRILHLTKYFHNIPMLEKKINVLAL